MHMNRKFSDTEMKLVHIVKYIIFGLGFVFIGIGIWRCIFPSEMKYYSIFSIAMSLLMFLNVYRINKAIKLGGNKLTTYQAKVFLCQFDRGGIGFILAYCLVSEPKFTTNTIILFVFFLLAIAGEVFFAKVDIAQQQYHLILEKQKEENEKK